MKLHTLAALVLICMSPFALAQQAPDGLQFNVPYLCNDGNVYVVHRCEKWPSRHGAELTMTLVSL